VYAMLLGQMKDVRKSLEDLGIAMGRFVQHLIQVTDWHLLHCGGKSLAIEVSFFFRVRVSVVGYLADFVRSRPII